MKRHASPHQPDNGALRRTREHYSRRAVRREIRQKGKTMKRRIVQGTIGVAMLGSAVAGIALVSADGGPDKRVNWSDPVPCYKTIEQVLICELGSPAASPVASETPVPLPTIVPTVAPEPTTVIDTIVELPSTGTGGR